MKNSIFPKEISRKRIEKLVEQTKEFVRSGDVIQTVLSQRFSIFRAFTVNLYRAIRAINPSLYVSVESDDFAIVEHHTSS